MAKKKSYPANLLEQLRVNKVTNSSINYENLTEDQLEGLEYVLANQLTRREAIGFNHYFQENMSCKAIGEKYELTEYRIKQIIREALRKLQYNPEWLFYIANGYEAQTEYVQAQLDMEEGKYCEERGIADKTHLYYQDISVLGFPARVLNPLTKSGIKSVRDLILFIGSSDRIRHLGELSCSLICNKLVDEGLLPSKLEKDFRYNRFYNIPRIDEELRVFRRINSYSQKSDS